VQRVEGLDMGAALAQQNAGAKQGGFFGEVFRFMTDSFASPHPLHIHPGRHGPARIRVWQGEARRGRPGMAGFGKARHGMAGEVRRGAFRRVRAWQGTFWHGRRGAVRSGKVRLVGARLGWARRGRHGRAWLWSGGARWGEAGFGRHGWAGCGWA
jgi:hypothetical protein